MTSKFRLRAFPLKFYFEIIALLGMLVTLQVPGILSPITIWSEMSILLFLRAFVWLLGLLILPGACILRLAKIGRDLSIIEKSALEISFSFLFVGMMALILYSLRIDFALLPWFSLGILAILEFSSWFKRKEQPKLTKPEITRWHLALLVELVVIVSLVLMVQISQRYLIPGDNWLAAKSATEILSQRDVYQSFRIIEYPIMFGFMLSGLSVCSGAPVINTYVLLSPLVVLNIIAFYALVKIVFSANDKVATISSLFYGLGGGLGFLIQILVYNGTKDFWGLSFLSQDMYFFTFFWNNVMFSYKFLAISLAYTSIILLMISLKSENKTRRVISLIMSSFLMLFSFLLHMLEPMFFVPLILAIIFVETRGRRSLIYSTMFLLGAFVFGYVLDCIMAGLYSSLAMMKLQSLVSSINVSRIAIYSSLLLTGVFAVLLVRHFLRNQLNSQNSSKNRRIWYLKYVIVAAITVVYVSGLWFWASTAPSLDVSSVFPWYRYVTRYGFLGGLAIIGLAVTSWKGKWFIIASFWSIFAIFLGSLWWGERTNAYLFPMLAVFATYAINRIWSTGNKINLRLSIERAEASIRAFRLKLKPLVAALIAVLLILSFSSVFYGVGYYIFAPPPTSDDATRAFEWIHQNTPENATFLVPKDYVISKGIYTIGDRSVYQNANLTSTVDSASFTNLVKSLHAYNITYAVTIEDAVESDLMKSLLTYSILRFQSGKVKIFELPALRPPSQIYSVAVLDRELLGLRDSKNNYGWVDDEFTGNWTYQNVNANSDGEVLTIRWEFHSGGTLEPAIKKNIPTVNTNDYQYIVIKYRNTPETTSTAENNLGQIVTLINDTGYPQGFIKNIYLPISKRDTFFTFVEKLPENQSIATLSMWMRNYKQLNGTLDLQIDYIGFASNDPTLEPQFQTRFLAMAIPALWPTNYTIVSNLTETDNTNILITTYDESVTDYVNSQSSINTFIFVNATATIPAWGTNWETKQQGVISGDLNGKSILIIGINAIRLNIAEDLSRLATFLYQKATQPA